MNIYVQLFQHMSDYFGTQENIFDANLIHKQYIRRGLHPTKLG